MNSENQIAKTIMATIKMHEKSYNWKTQEYSLDMETCLIIVCKKNKLSTNMWALLSLAMHWLNDIQEWAQTVLTGKNAIDTVTNVVSIDCDACGENILVSEIKIGKKDTTICTFCKENELE